MSAVEQSITDEQQAWLDGLRAMADWFEQHPEWIDESYPAWVNIYPSSKANLARLTKDLGRVEKIHDENLFYVRRRFGPHQIDGNVMRQEVCRRVVTGTKQIPERVVPAHEEEVVEWECSPSLLGDAPGGALDGEQVTS